MVVPKTFRLLSPRLISLALAVLGWGASAGLPDAPCADPATQRQVIELLQMVIQEHWNGAEASSNGSTNAAGSSTNLEAAFRKAAALMPDRLDLRFGIASALMIQALQTNGQQLEVKVKAALHEYQEIQSLDTNDFSATMLYAAYARAIGETNTSQSMLDTLMKRQPGRTREYLQRFSSLDASLQMTPREEPPTWMPNDKRHAIVVLGAGLETNGLAKAKLIARLEQCRKLARRYPKAPIILTGGNQKGGVTEAYVMSQWCQHKGISKKRLILEDKARDTIENALYSSVILRRLGVTHVTLVTSASHLRRGLDDLQEACQQRGLHLEYATLAASKGDAALDREQERLGIYRDVMRLSGLWAFPGLQR